MNLIPLITAAGLNAVINASNDGLQAKIAAIALGDSAWTPDQAADRLLNERARVPISGSTRVNPTQIHITAIEGGDVEYWVREIGFYLDDGTLLAIWSQPDVERPLAYKAASIDLLLGFDLVLSALPVDSITIEDAGGLNLGPATSDVAGVVRLATEEEVLEGARNDIALSPLTAQALFQLATPEKVGVVRIATEEEALAGTNNDAVMTPFGVKQSVDRQLDDALPAASEGEPGLVRFATALEALQSDADNVAMSPRTMVLLGDKRYRQQLSLGPVQLSGFLNNFDAVIDFTCPTGTFMVGLNSFHDNGTEDRRWRVRYQRIELRSGPSIPPIIFDEGDDGVPVLDQPIAVTPLISEPESQMENT